MTRFAPLFMTAAATTAFPLTLASAQTTQPALEIGESHTLLTVSGQGESMREPDMAMFSAGVTSQGSTAADALGQNAMAMEQVIVALKRAGIADRDIQTSNLSINPVYHDPQRDAAMQARMSGQPYVPPPPESMVPKIIGYQANNTVSVRQRKLGDYGKVIDTLANAGANQINGPNFQLDDPDPAMDEARRDAVREARERAEIYANAAGLRIIRIVSINEGGGYFGPPPTIFATASHAGGPPPPPPPPPSPVQPGEMQMTVGVTMQFELAR